MPEQSFSGSITKKIYHVEWPCNDCDEDIPAGEILWETAEMFGGTLIETVICDECCDEYYRPKKQSVLKPRKAPKEKPNNNLGLF